MIRRGVALLMALGALALCGCDGPNAMRRQFVALRHLQSAQQHLATLPRDPARANQELDRALELLPSDRGLRERAAPLYVVAHQYEKAIPLLEETPGNDTRTKIMLAQCLLQTGQAERGRDICRSVLDEAAQLHRSGKLDEAQFALWLNDAGYVLADADVDLARAEPAIESAVRTEPLQAAFVDSLGWARFRQGKLEEAAFYLERAARLSRNPDPEMYYHLGAVYARLGRLREAEKQLQHARRLDPGNPEVERELRRLGRTLVPPVVMVELSQAGPDGRQPAS